MSKDNLCYHCNSPIPKNTNILWERESQTLQFCCNGCQTVAKIIIESGNDKFYSYRGSQSIEPVRSPDEDKRIREEYLDGELVREEYIQSLHPEESILLLTITNIHCSACVWLNEKVLNDTEGILSSRINFATGRANIHYDPNRIKVSEIFSIIESIGYLPRLYSPWKDESKLSQNKSLLIRMGIAGFCFGNIMLFGTALYAGYFSGIELEWKRLLHYLSWVFATPVYFYSGYPFLRGAWQGLKQYKLSMDFLLVTGISLAYFYSIYVTLTDIGEVYFDSVCMIYFFILLGKYLEDNARIKASDKLSGLLSSLPEVATILLEDGTQKVMRTSEIKKDMKALITSGERIPVDGFLLGSISYVDESFLTGESKPVTKNPGDKILAGSLNKGNPFTIQAESDSKNSTLSRLKILIESAMGEKPKMERITDRIASYFISVVFFLAMGTFLYWNYLSTVGLETALVYTISVLIVACPCALGLAVPTALVMNHIRNSKMGIVIKNPDSVETLSRVDAIFLDKTGTLTQGKLRIVSFRFPDEMLAGEITVGLEKFSHHPIAKNIIQEIRHLWQLGKLGQNNLTETETHKWEFKDVQELSGLGMTAILSGTGKYSHISGQIVKLGSAHFLGIKEDSERTRIHLSLGEEYLGYWELEDSLRKDSQETIRTLQKTIPHIALLSGDAVSVVAKVADQSGIQKFHGGVSPEEKLRIITESQESQLTTAMVGDGINDSAALARADIGISMGIAADLSLDKSDVILVNNELSGLATTIAYARGTQSVIRQNLIISFTYNSIMLPLAAMGFMAPVICAVFMALSSLTVVGNSLRLRS